MSTPEPSPRIDENLTAYLDGELNEAVTKEIESTLADSAQTRQRVDSLISTWEMLDLLPRARASEDFTERTMSCVSIPEAATQRLPVAWSKNGWSKTTRRGAALAVGAAGLVLAAGLGFLATNRWVPNESDRLVRDLPLIENLDLYTEIDNVEFLKELQQSGLFDDEQE